MSLEAVKMWRRMQRDENELWNKRMYLMGWSEMDSCDQSVRSCAGKQLVMPESILRKDDVFYEDVKIFVEKSFLQASDTEARHGMIEDDDEGFCEIQNLSKFILTLLDDLSNNGMYRLAKMFTKGTVTFCRTRPQMKRVIKNSLQKMHINQLDSKYYGQMKNELSQLLKNPINFRQNYWKRIKFTRKSLDSAFNKVQFRSIPVRILCVMYRRLQGKQGIMPRLRPRLSGWERKRLIVQMKKVWVNMISQLDESDKIHDTLVKALAVPGLYSKIASNSHDLSLAKFIRVPPEMEVLHNKTVKAIRSLGHRRFKKEELKTLQHLLDPESNVDVNDLRRAIRNMLIDCLIECSDVEVVPESLWEALSIINKKSCTLEFLSKEVIEEEVECILNVGADMKQLLWDRVPLDKIDHDFEDAYMEELEESDDGDFFDDDDDDDQHLRTNSLDEIQIKFNDFSEEVASTGDADHACPSSSPSTCKNTTDQIDSSSFRDSNIIGGETLSTAAGDGSALLVSPVLQGNGEMMNRQDPVNNASVDSGNSVEDCSKPNGLNPMSEFQRNRYIDIQEMCDQTSLVAYELIGQVLAEFGRKDALGLDGGSESYLSGEYGRSENFLGSDADSKDKTVSGSVILRAVHKVIPSFPSSELEIVKKFMNS